MRPAPDDCGRSPAGVAGEPVWAPEHAGMRLLASELVKLVPYRHGKKHFFAQTFPVVSFCTLTRARGAFF